MPSKILCLGEIQVEIMRTGVNLLLDQAGMFAEPFTSGEPAIFIDAVARLGGKAGFIGMCGDAAFD